MNTKIVTIPAETSVVSIGVDGISSTPIKTEIAIKPPSKSKPGFLRRQRRLMELQQRLKVNDPQALDEMVRFLLDNADEVQVPAGVDPFDAVYDLSKEDFEALVNATGGAEVDPTNGG